MAATQRRTASAKAGNPDELIWTKKGFNLTVFTSTTAPGDRYKNRIQERKCGQKLTVSRTATRKRWSTYLNWSAQLHCRLVLLTSSLDECCSELVLPFTAQVYWGPIRLGRPACKRLAKNTLAKIYNSVNNYYKYQLLFSPNINNSWKSFFFLLRIKTFTYKQGS